MSQSSSKQIPGIFISYRRDDSSGHAGRLFDRLADHFGRDRIFMDIDTIEPGEDFVTLIENVVGSCEILVAIIGRHWLSGADEASGWLHNPNDFVRLEIAIALDRNIRVIPVLVQRATMPKPQDLPGDLAKFSRRNAVELSDLRWRADVDQLINVLERILVQQEERERLANAARQADEEHQCQAGAERLVAEEKQLELAREVARRAAEDRDREAAELERRAVEEQMSHQAQQASIGRTEEEHVRAAAVEAKLPEAESEPERGLDQTRSEKEHDPRKTDGAEREGAAEQGLHSDPQEKEIKSDLSVSTAAPSFGSAALVSGSHAIPSFAFATPLQDRRRKRTMLVVIIGCISLLAIVVLILLIKTSNGDQQATHIGAQSASVERTGPGTNALPTLAPTPAASPTPTPVPTPDKTTFQKILAAFIKKKHGDGSEVKEERKIAYGDLDADGAADAAASFCVTWGGTTSNVN
jgi:hypothetical protein